MSQSVLITGAGSGIGFAVAVHLARQGMRVYGSVRTTDAERRLLESGAGITPIRLDVTDAESVAAARDKIGGELAGEGLATLVNNSGIALPAPLEMAPLDGVRAELETNALGALRVTRGFLPLLKKASGSVFFLGSPLSTKPRALCGGYAASKAALRSIADTLRLELTAEGIGVCHVEADKIATPLWSKVSGELDHLPDSGAYGSAVSGAKRLIAAAESGEGFAQPEIVAQAIWEAMNADPLPSEVRVP